MRKLELKFLNGEGKIITYTLDNPIEPADPETIKEAMDTILQENAFYSSGGDLTEIHSARIVERFVEDIAL
ncbi:DUF2922 domain-containing protein [Oceanobacillus neutriphilus]|uniref:DUF2922 domain-containing protein n=1 Tax=Oceanobacillus neutriphilus TaxID=531815 RepID=A0ABQ2P339_9BACI|nr:DUF2922 domain-containing protein [Oceanobacillus neutriphilus]GGP16863.1 hypothetical protein GCM10011346_50520 [Oceanobacillus neutriphilus]